MKRMDILAPAGGQEQLVAAVRAGADAVYLGTTGFNARRNAQNFDDAALMEAVSYCHARGVEVYVTVNTLVREDELDAVLCALRTICRAGADAVIVQDLAVARLVREHCPDLTMIGSTQMTIHNRAGAKALEALGFRRAVLARELTIEEIKTIAASTSLEIEVFVHGALCMCVSGGCYLSAMLGGRSGNRGRCAQPCRLNFKTPDGRDHALSLKDMSYLRHLAALADAGVSSLKIEGRMKRPEYVAAAVSACRNARDGEAYDMQLLQDVFSRGGFTDGYLTGSRTLDMFGYRTKDDVDGFARAAGKTGELTRAERQSVPVQMAFTLRAGAPAALQVTDGKYTAQATGDIPEQAINRPTDAESARRNLEKTGGTPFYTDGFTADIEDGLMLPASKLNELRRDALDALLAMRSAPDERLFLDTPIVHSPAYDAPETPTLRVRAERFAQLSSLPLAGIDRVILPVAEVLTHPAQAAALDEKLIAELPALLFPTQEAALGSDLEKLRAMGVRDALCENIGMVMLALDAKLTPHGGHGLNILNSEALCAYEQLGLRDATISFELDFERIRALGGVAPRGVLVYGYLPLMRFRACPVQRATGHCTECDGRQTLYDRRGNLFTVLCTGKQYQSLLNTVPLYLSDKRRDGVDWGTLYFTTETPAEVRAVYDAFLHNEKPPEAHTNGLYFREIE